MNLNCKNFCSEHFREAVKASTSWQVSCLCAVSEQDGGCHQRPSSPQTRCWLGRKLSPWQNSLLAKTPARLFSRVKLTLKKVTGLLFLIQMFWHQVPHMRVYKTQFTASRRHGPAVSSKIMLEWNTRIYVSHWAIKYSWVARTSLLKTPTLTIIQSVSFCLLVGWFFFSYCFFGDLAGCLLNKDRRLVALKMIWIFLDTWFCNVDRIP